MFPKINSSVATETINEGYLTRSRERLERVLAMIPNMTDAEVFRLCVFLSLQEETAVRAD